MSAKYIGSSGLTYLWNKIKANFLSSTTPYAHSSSVDGDAYRAVSIPFGQVDSTSTSTAFTATVPGITELRDGVCVYLRNGVVTSAANCTLNINGLGAKRIYYTQGATSAVTTHFNVSYTELFVYNSSRVEGGCWDLLVGYYSDANSLGYSGGAYYKCAITKKTLHQSMIVLTCMDGQLLPVYDGTRTTAQTKQLTTLSFDPFGEVYYNNMGTDYAEGDVIAVGANFYAYHTNSLGDLRYAFNEGKTLTANKPIYIKCVPQSDGSVKLSDDPIAQDLPNSDDGYVYKFIGRAADTYRFILLQEKPVYYYKDGAIRLWTNSGIQHYYPN